MSAEALRREESKGSPIHATKRRKNSKLRSLQSALIFVFRREGSWRTSLIYETLLYQDQDFKVFVWETAGMAQNVKTTRQKIRQVGKKKKSLSKK